MLALLVTIAAIGQGPAEAPGAVVAAAQPVVLQHTEADAVGWAFEALLGYPEADQPYIRFVYVPAWADPEWIGVVDFAVNTAASHSRNLIRGDRHAGGWLLAYNLKALAPEPKELARLLATWDGLAIKESRFHVPAIDLVDVVEIVEVQERDRFGRLVKVKKNHARQVSRRTAFLAPHLEAKLAQHATDATRSARVDVLVAQLTRSTGGIYPADFLVEQLLTSLRGNYVEFRQIDLASADSRLTPLEAHLRKRGFFFDAAKDARGDKGAVQLVSEVTGKSRIVLAVFGLASRTPMTITFDFKDSNTRPDAQFIRNLIEFDRNVDASEIFIPLPNGLIEYVLADGRGQIQRAAPADVVADSTKPNGHTKELEMGMSCVVCHAPHDGYQPVRNDLELLLGSDADFFGEQIEVTRGGAKRVLSRQEALDLVVGRYTEPLDEPDGILGRARRDYMRAVALLADYQIEAGGKSAVARLGDKTREIYHDYRYARIGADRACLELGLKVPPGTGRTYLKQLVPPPAAGEREDVLIALLRNGAEIRRDDMDAIYVEMARRATATRQSFGASKP